MLPTMPLFSFAAIATAAARFATLFRFRCLAAIFAGWPAMLNDYYLGQPFRRFLRFHYFHNIFHYVHFAIAIIAVISLRFRHFIITPFLPLSLPPQYYASATSSFHIAIAIIHCCHTAFMPTY